MKRFSLLIFYLCCAHVVSAQVSVQAFVDKTTVSLYELFTFEIKTNANCAINTPDFGDLEVVGEPYQYENKSSMNINGVYSQHVEYVTIFQLRAKKTGTFKIPSIILDCGDEIHKTQVVEIKATDEIDPDFFMRMTCNKTRVVKGEPFTLTLTYYAKERPETFEAMDLGNANGVWRQDLNPDKRTFPMGTEVINGRSYHVILLREELCFAQKEGKITIEPYAAHLVFAPDFFNRYQKSTYSNSLVIDVEGIQDNDDTDFNGLVGEFSIFSEASHTNVNIGEAIDFSFVLEGKGNQEQTLLHPEANFPESFNTFDPQIEEKTTATAVGMEGQIVYNYTIVPTKPGKYIIPADTIEYYDLKNRKLRLATTSSIEINVKKPDGYIDPNDADSSKKATNETDIHYIEEGEAHFFQEDDFIFGSWTYYGLLSSPLLLSFFFIFVKRRKENQSDEDLVKIQQKKAIKIAQAALKDVRQTLDAGEDNKALKGLQSTLINFFRQKFNVGLSELSQKEISKRLESNEVDLDLRLNFNQIWNAIEMGQYAPIPHENLIKTVDDTEALLTALDKKI